MQFAEITTSAPINEVDLLLAHLPLAGSTVLELGCGKAEKSRQLVERGQIERLIACEVDVRQHAANLGQAWPPQIEFLHAGAEAIPLPDASVDRVLMFKSLHHVAPSALPAALTEIARVLKPGGSAWISEPIYAGEMNELFKLFHDEQVVRTAAFAALQAAVSGGALQLCRQFFFNTRSYFADFAQFEQRILQVTHSDHHLPPALYAAVRAKFESYLGPDGVSFINPQRVDWLRKAP